MLTRRFKERSVGGGACPDLKLAGHLPVPPRHVQWHLPVPPRHVQWHREVPTLIFKNSAFSSNQTKKLLFQLSLHILFVKYFSVPFVWLPVTRTHSQPQRCIG